MERAVSLAVVKPDHAPIVDSVLDAVNLAAAGVAIANAKAGFAIQSVAVLGGWVWNKWKFDRVSPVLEEVAKRIQGIEHDYVRREEFADLLWDGLRRIGDQPDAVRRGRLRNILLNVVSAPKDHEDNRLFLRLADELSAVETRVLLATLGKITRDELMWANNKILAARASVADEDIDLVMSYLAMDKLLLGMKFHDKAPSSGLGFLLTPTGEAFVRYIRD
jgi:hypothetical protein